jgi:glucose-1-phosphate cytidylyltransferase
MKVVILAGGFGTRISEESHLKPKPMIEIGERPILWHIMKIYSAYGINEFIICCGYKGYVIKEYFANYFLHQSDITLDIRNNRMEVLQNVLEPWKITLIDTGEKTMTGGRLKKVREYVNNETFCLTYGDGVTDLNINKLLEFHKVQKPLVTLTAVQPPGRFGTFKLENGDNKINSFKEKPKGDGAWVNGGFFMVEPQAIDYIEEDMTVWEEKPLQNLARDGKLSAFRHDGFWQSMDTLRDKNVLEDLWKTEKAPWKIW